MRSLGVPWVLLSCQGNLVLRIPVEELPKSKMKEKQNVYMSKLLMHLAKPLSSKAVLTDLLLQNRVRGAKGWSRHLSPEGMGILTGDI